ncbi:arsenic resistance N-acetyltransferase ArsN2 [Pleomorphomonas carboxyditropha]|uniref:Arsenate reductase n=1 Tax=Pleomorphomonas carboxyditropha TaxID=2023338 RepID=A0A2G9WSM4_9HYPH|nr:arsenic resistance N-acetyltransferase ArsN2 [Pleomorphomonas carboxyditropha]PIO97654.1 arsenate reductase (glutaredoxin) [Pleomorphomonas carboxyditropha]
MDVTIYHNPACGTSTNTLALIRHAGIEPTVIEYLKAPPDRATLRGLISRAGMKVHDALRQKGTPYAELGLGPDMPEDILLDAMMAHPILINRPLVVTPKGVKLCRPSDMVLDLLPEEPLPDFIKDDGEPALRDTAVTGDDAGLLAALAVADLPTYDLSEPGRAFFAFRSLFGELLGYGGFELYGEEVFLRSLVVLPERRGAGVGKAIVARLARRAFDLGGRRLWLLTTTAVPFFETIKFKHVDRADAPASILATRQAQGLCPSLAAVLTRPIYL